MPNQIDAAGNIVPGINPAGPNPDRIKHIIEDALNIGGYSFSWTNKAKQPYRGIFDNGTKKIDLYIYAWRIQFGARGRDNEQRIEITTSVNPIGFNRRITANKKTLLLGIYDCPSGVPIIAAWDALSNARAGKQKSCFVSIQNLQSGLKNGIHKALDSKGNSIITFTPGYFGQYIDLVRSGNVLSVKSSSRGLAKSVSKATLKHRKAGTIRNMTMLLKSASALSKTEKDTLVKQRVGQELFRDMLITKYGCKCVLCNISTQNMLVASHIKAWSDCSTNAERLDPNNGLLLCAHHDALFDKHLISFDSSGSLVVSSTLSATEQVELGIPSIPGIKASKKMAPYLAIHKAKLK